jgi:hypothetical protein
VIIASRKKLLNYVKEICIRTDSDAIIQHVGRLHARGVGVESAAVTDYVFITPIVDHIDTRYRYETRTLIESQK